MSEFDFEPVHGLPGRLPEGESLRWQGAPRMGTLARRAFHVQTIAIYFGLLILLRFVFLLTGGMSLAEAVLSALWLATLGGLAIVILAVLAWLYSRSTVYSISDRRLVIRFGVALPMAVNIPFKVIESAALRTWPDGTGDITLVLGGGQKVNYFIMWPNVRPWHIWNAQPMIRCIPEAEKVAQLLSDSLREASGAEGPAATAAVDGPAPDGAAAPTGAVAGQPAGQ